MDPLISRPLLTLYLDVDFAGMLSIGTTVHGRRRIAPVSGGRFEGERLNGVVLPGGADWVINRPDGHMAIDVRLPLKTHDDALILCSYQGLFRAATPEAMTRFGRGERLADEEYRLRTVVRFETGAEPYRWLNDMIAIGIGRQPADGAMYSIHEIV